MRSWVAGLVVVAMAVGAGSAQAQRSARFGVNVDLGTDHLNFGLGARGNFDMNEIANWKNIEGIVSFDYFFPDGELNYWELNANAAYKFTTKGGSATPYAGAGLNFSHTSVDNCPANFDCGGSDVGLNLLGGVQFKAAKRLVPFIEGRFVVGNGNHFVATAGVYF